jgi:hypothetical protein
VIELSRVKQPSDAGLPRCRGRQWPTFAGLSPGGARERLVPKEIPYSEIERRGAGMYRGIARGKQAMADHQSEQRRGSGDHYAPV